MVFDFAQTKSRARRVVHNTLAVAAFYTDASVDDFDPVEIKARWHNRLQLFGDPEQEGYAQLVQGIDRIVLFPDDYPGITFKRGDVIEFPSYAKTFELAVRETSDGPLKIVWQATEKAA